MTWGEQGERRSSPHPLMILRRQAAATKVQGEPNGCSVRSFISPAGEFLSSGESGPVLCVFNPSCVSPSCVTIAGM